MTQSLDFKVFAEGSGGGSGVKNSRDSLWSTDGFEMVLGICEGPIYGLQGESITEKLQNLFVDDIPILDQDGKSNFSDSEFVIRHEKGTLLSELEDEVAGQGYIKYLMGGNTTPHPVSKTLVPGVEHIQQIPTSIKGQYDRVEVRIAVNQLYRISKKGYKNSVAKLKLFWRYVGENWQHFPSKPLLSDEHIIEGKTTVGGYVQGFTFAIDDKTRDIEISVTLLEVEDDEKYIQSLSWISYETEQVLDPENISEREYHPGTSMLQVASVFGNEIQRLPNITGIWKGLLCAVPSNYNPTTKTYDENTPWDGTFSSEKKWTDNPFWIAHELYTNTSFGYFKVNPRVTLDRFNVYNLAKYADEEITDTNGQKWHRFTFNGVLSTPENGQDLINYVLGSANAQAYDNELGQIIFVADMNVPSVATITPEQCVELSEGIVFNYTYTDIKDRPNELITSYTDANLDWEKQHIGPISDLEAQNKFGTNTLEYETLGCIYANEAWRKGYFRLISAQTETTSVSFQLPSSGIRFQLFDIINIVDPDQDWGISARAKSYSDKVLSLREPIYFEEIGNYNCHLQMLDGEVEIITFEITTIGYHYQIILTLAPVRSLSPTPTFSVQREGSAPGLAKPFRIIAVGEADQDTKTVTITAIEVNRNKFHASDNLTLTSSPRYNFENPAVGESPKNITLLKQEYVQGDSGMEINLWLTWDEPAKYYLGAYYEVTAIKNGTNLGVMAQTSTNLVEIQEVNIAEYTFMVSMVYNGNKTESEPFQWSVDYLSFELGQYSPENLTSHCSAEFDSNGNLSGNIYAEYQYHEDLHSVSDIISNEEISHINYTLSNDLENDTFKSGVQGDYFYNSSTTKRELEFSNKTHLELRPQGLSSSLKLIYELVAWDNSKSKVFSKILRAEALPKVTALNLTATPQSLSAQVTLENSNYTSVDIDWFITEAGIDDSPEFNSNYFVRRSPQLLDYVNVIQGRTYYVWARSVGAFGSTEIFPTDTTLVKITLPTLTLEDIFSFERSNFSSDVNDLLEQVDKINGSLDDVVSEIIDDVSGLKATETTVFEEYKKVAVDAIKQITASALRDLGLAQYRDEIESWKFQLDDDLQQLLLESGNISPNEWLQYKLKVDGQTGTLSSLAQRQTQTEDGLTTVSSSIIQQAERIAFLEESTNFGDVAAQFNSVQLQLDSAQNALTQQATSYRITKLDLLNQILVGAIQKIELAELEVDFSVAKKELVALTDETQSLAQDNKTLLSQFDSSLSGLTQTNKALATTVIAQAEDKKTLLSTKDNLAATIEVLNKTVVDVEGNAEATSEIIAQINNEESGLNALAGLLLSAQQFSNALAQSHAILTAKVNHETEGLNAIAALALLAKQTADGLGESHALLSAQVNHETNGLNALSTLYLATKQLAEDNAESYAQLQAEIENEESGLNALATLILGLQQVNNELIGQIFLGFDDNGRLTGYRQGLSGGYSNIEMAADSVSYVNPDTGEKIIDYDLNAKIVRINALLKAENIEGEQASGKAKTISGENLATYNKLLVQFTVRSAPWSRRIVMPCPWFVPSTPNDVGEVTVQWKKDDVVFYEDSLLSGSYYFSGPPQSYVLAANQSATFKVVAKIRQGSPAVNAFSQSYAVTVFKDSNEITFN